jgi:hypothetical protein
LKRSEERTDTGARGRQQRNSGDHRVDDRPMGGFRGPLVFGVVAATIELAIIVALIYC